MIRATGDTNVLAPTIRRVGQTRSVVAPILGAWKARNYELVLSEYVLSEIRRVLATPYFSRYLKPPDLDAAIETFRADATIIPITVVVEGAATHPGDDLILATALSGQADYLVTLDRQLLALESHGGVRIVTPHAFLTTLAAES